MTSEASNRRRVKLYTLNDNREWDDTGTGHVSALYTEQNNMALVVISEADGSRLLESKIQPDTAYQKQQATLIVWSESENLDLALSFQEKVGCDDIWEKICNVQGKDPTVLLTQDVIDDSDNADDPDRYASSTSQLNQAIDLPTCELGRLEEIVEVISQGANSQIKKDRLVTTLEQTDYIKQLTELFHKAEDLEDMNSLYHLYEIIRQIIFFNKHALYDVIFAEDKLMDIIGILEYSPAGRKKHREFIRNQATFKEVLPLHNPELVSKIHQTYRVQYIQDCCLPPPCLFDEHTLSTLKSFVSINKIEIISALQEDEGFMCRLFTCLKDPETDHAHRRELALFAKEFCNISVQTDQKDNFLNCLCQHGALGTVEVLLSINDRDIKSAALEILQAFVEHQPSMVREYAHKETAAHKRDDEFLINIMISQLLNDSDPELSDAFLLGYMLRSLIDPESMANTDVRGVRTEFLSFFYKRCINTLTKPLFENTRKEVPEQDDYHTALVMNNILDLLTFCIENHTYHMKNYCFNFDLLKRVLVLLKSSHKFLVLAALRLLRRVINMKEEFYHRYLVKNNLIEPVVELFISNGHRYNLVDSAIIEFFEYIRIENISQLIIHIVENFGDVLTRVTYVQTFLGLRKAYEHIHRGPRASFLSSPVCGQQPTLDMLPLHNHQTPVAVGSVASGLANSVSVSSGTGSTIAFSGIRSLSSVSSVVHSSTRESRGGLDAEEEQWFEQEEEEDEEEEEEDDEGGDSVGVNAAGEDANLAFSNADNSLSAFFERISAKQNSVSVASSVSKLSSLSSRSDEDEEDVELLNNALSSVSKVAPRKGLSKRLSTSGSNGKPSLLRQATPIAIRIKSTTQQLAAAAASKCIAFDEEEDDESEDPDDELSFEDDDEAPLHGLKQESRARTSSRSLQSGRRIRRSAGLSVSSSRDSSGSTDSDDSDTETAVGASRLTKRRRRVPPAPNSSSSSSPSSGSASGSEYAANPTASLNSTKSPDDASSHSGSSADSDNNVCDSLHETQLLENCVKSESPPIGLVDYSDEEDEVDEEEMPENTSPVENIPDGVSSVLADSIFSLTESKKCTKNDVQSQGKLVSTSRSQDSTPRPPLVPTEQAR